MIIRNLIKASPLAPVHIGQYMRYYRWLRDLANLDMRSIHRVCDAGCGSGQYAFTIKRKWPHVTVVALDLVPTRRLMVEAEELEVQVRSADLADFRDEGVYDLICCIDVIDDIPAFEVVLSNFQRALTPGGLLYIHLPLHPRVLSFFKHKVIEQYVATDEANSLARNLDPQRLQALLKIANFEIKDLTYTIGPLGTISWELDRLLDRYRLIQCLLCPLLKIMAVIDGRTRPKRGNGFRIIAQKREH